MVGGIYDVVYRLRPWLLQYALRVKQPLHERSHSGYRDVTDSMFAGGAKGDGITHDTKAINAAIAYGGNCGANSESSSIKGTLIYFPPYVTGAWYPKFIH